MTQKTYVLIGR